MACTVFSSKAFLASRKSGSIFREKYEAWLGSFASIAVLQTASASFICLWLSSNCVINDFI